MNKKQEELKVEREKNLGKYIQETINGDDEKNLSFPLISMGAFKELLERGQDKAPKTRYYSSRHKIMSKLMECRFDLAGTNILFVLLTAPSD